MTYVYPRESNAAHAPRLSPAYKSTVKRAPTKPLVIIPHTLSELTGPVYGHETIAQVSDLLAPISKFTTRT